MGYALLREKAPLGQKVEDLGLHLENVLLSDCCVRGKSAANDECASGAVLPGQYFDEETNLHYNHFRYYDPELGRYIASDPIGLFAGTNTYSYANQNSLSFYDPYGLDVLNNSPGPVIVKGGGRNEPNGRQTTDGLVTTIGPGETFPGGQDALMTNQGPNAGDVFKTVNNIDAIVNPDGSIDTNVAPGTGPIDSIAAFFGQMIIGGEVSPNKFPKIFDEFCRQNPGAPNCPPPDDGQCK